MSATPTKAAAPKTYTATGKRKSAIARVILAHGTGLITVNHKPMTQYFPLETQQLDIKTPLKAVDLEDRFDIAVNVCGGGYSAQAVAVQNGISKALVTYDAELRSVLKPLKMLRRDSREKERQKYGQRGARARYQYSKR